MSSEILKEIPSNLETCRAVGVDIPTLCHDERLKPIGICRMCLVIVEGKPHPMTACNTSLLDGMEAPRGQKYWKMQKEKQDECSATTTFKIRIQ